MKSNFEIVMRYLKQFEGEQSVQLPDGYHYGMSDDQICLVMHNHDIIDGEFVPTGEEEWLLQDIPINYFIKQCNLLTETDVLGMIFSLGMQKGIRDGIRNTDVS